MLNYRKRISMWNSVLRNIFQPHFYEISFARPAIPEIMFDAKKRAAQPTS